MQDQLNQYETREDVGRRHQKAARAVHPSGFMSWEIDIGDGLPYPESLDTWEYDTALDAMKGGDERAPEEVLAIVAAYNEGGDEVYRFETWLGPDPEEARAEEEHREYCRWLAHGAPTERGFGGTRYG